MISFFWLFFGVLVFSVFLGNVMSTINIQIAEAAIDGPGKLAGFNVRILIAGSKPFAYCHSCTGSHTSFVCPLSCS
jgi:hypothetical protein